MVLWAALWREGRGVATYLAALAAICLLLASTVFAVSALESLLTFYSVERPIPQWPYWCLLGAFGAVLVGLLVWFYRWFRWGFGAAGSGICYGCGYVGIAALIALSFVDPFSAFLRHVDQLGWVAFFGLLIGFFAFLRCFTFARTGMKWRTICGALTIIASLSPVPFAVALNASKLTSAETVLVTLPVEEDVIWSASAETLSQISRVRVPCSGYEQGLYPAVTMRSDRPFQRLRVVRPENEPAKARLISAVKWGDGQWRCDAITIYKAPSDTRKATLYLGFNGSAPVDGDTLIKVRAK